MTQIKRALVSVSDKTQLNQICQFLKEMGVEIISTGGTAKYLEKHGIKITMIDEVTHFPEMLNGRVKTLHPKIHGALLGLRDNEDHIKTMEAHDIKPIDCVIVNLYPFEKVLGDPDSSSEEIIENIDIGGPSMIRSAAKNFKSVAVVTHPSQYQRVIKELKDNDGSLTLEFKKELALSAFTLTSHYDRIISSFFKYGKQEKEGYQEEFLLDAEKILDLRYGENPHQEAAFYKINEEFTEPSLVTASQIQGKQLSFNNILDFDGALSCMKEFKEPVCVIVKHTNPCGVAIGADVVNAFERAWAGDPVSSFGSVIAFNREIDGATAKALSAYFVEGIIAPDISSEAREILKTKKNLRVLLLPKITQWIENKNNFHVDDLDLKKICGGLLVQKSDRRIEVSTDWEVVTKKVPTQDQIEDLFFGWKVVKHVKSNAIAYVKYKSTIGIGAGQMSRIDSARIGIEKAVTDVSGSIMASDAFFPFRDSIDQASESKISAIIQPGGSVRDQEVIDACNEHDIAMVFTHARHFRH